MNEEKRKKYSKLERFIKSNIKYIILLFIILFLLVIIYIYTSNKPEKSINITGEENLKGLDINTYDVMALSLDINDEEIITVPISYSQSDDNIIRIAYYLNEETNYYKKVVNNSSNEEGVTFSNIDYEVITRSDLQEIIDDNKDGILTYIWASEDKKCLNVLVSYE